MPGLGLLPLICLGLIIRVCRRQSHDWREAILLAVVVWAFTLVAGTEALSAMHLIAEPALAALWVIVAGVAIAVGALKPDPPIVDRRIWAEMPWVERAMLAWLGVLFAIVLTTSLLAPPNTWDSMTYHMPRVMHWMAERSVEHYPTANIRQLYLAPLAEWIILHLQVLQGSDRLANLPQCGALVICAIGASLLAADLGARRRGQILAAVVAATAPAAVLQASGTQNNLVLAVWLIVVAHAGLSMRNRRTILLAGAAFGLAALTKGTAYSLGLPWVLLLALAALRQFRLAAIGPLFAAAMLAALPNVGHLLRNHERFHDPLVPAGDRVLFQCESHDARRVVGNVVRNLALHAGALGERPATWAERGTAALYRLMDTDLNDSATTFPGLKFGVVAKPTDEDFTGNPLHLLLVAIAVLSAVFAIRRHPPAAIFAACVAASFVCFCVLLKWQPWHTRMQVPVFVIAAALVGWAMERWRWRHATTAFATILLVWAIATAPGNSTRPFFGGSNIFRDSRERQYLRSRRRIAEPYLQMIEFLQRGSYDRIGVFITNDDWEYPLWPALDPHASGRLLNVSAPGCDANDAVIAADDRAAIVVISKDQALANSQWPAFAEAHGFGPFLVLTRPTH